MGKKSHISDQIITLRDGAIGWWLTIVPDDPEGRFFNYRQDLYASVIELMQANPDVTLIDETTADLSRSNETHAYFHTLRSSEVQLASDEINTLSFLYSSAAPSS